MRFFKNGFARHSINYLRIWHGLFTTRRGRTVGVIYTSTESTVHCFVSGDVVLCTLYIQTPTSQGRVAHRYPRSTIAIVRKGVKPCPEHQTHCHAQRRAGQTVTMKRYKMLPKPKRKIPPHKDLVMRTTPNHDRMRKYEQNYPSRLPVVHSTGRVENSGVSHTRTIAPAYNKGAYQVIPDSDIQYIGR